MSIFDDDIDRDPILRAIDKGGGQTCDCKGVVRALREAGFVIVRADVAGVVTVTVDPLAPPGERIVSVRTEDR